MNTKDIPGATSTQRHQARRNSGGYDPLNYRDVTTIERKSKRSCNPLDPKYDAIDDDGKRYEIGPIPGARATEMPGPPKPGRVQSLDTKDI